MLCMNRDICQKICQSFSADLVNHRLCERQERRKVTVADPVINVLPLAPERLVYITRFQTEPNADLGEVIRADGMKSISDSPTKLVDWNFCG
jgi:hypothetical protein